MGKRIKDWRQKKSKLRMSRDKGGSRGFQCVCFCQYKYLLLCGGGKKTVTLGSNLSSPPRVPDICFLLREGLYPTGIQSRCFSLFFPSLPIPPSSLPSHGLPPSCSAPISTSEPHFNPCCVCMPFTASRTWAFSVFGNVTWRKP